MPRNSRKPGLKDSGDQPQDADHLPGRTQSPHDADFVVHEGHDLNEDTPLIVVEAKAPRQDLKVAAAQAASYAQASKAPYLLLTDGKLLQIWQLQPTRRSERVLLCPIGELRQRNGEIEPLIGRSASIARCAPSATHGLHAPPGTSPPTLRAS